jgi:mono/diheme cytochrome c family protein
MIKLASASILALAVFAGSVLAQQTSVPDDVQEGKRLAVLICANCHIVARDQSVQPILQPPAPSFETIAQRRSSNVNSIREFLVNTHRDISNPQGMPNSRLQEYEIPPLTAYLLSLRKQP